MKVESKGRQEEIKFPGLKDIGKWKIFCFGTEGIPAQQPITSLVVSLGQKRTKKLLRYFIQWLRDSEKKAEVDSLESVIDDQFCKWLFALLMVVEEPLDSNMAADLSEMRKIMHKTKNRLLRNSKSAEKFVTPNLDVILIIIEDIFGQKEPL